MRGDLFPPTRAIERLSGSARLRQASRGGPRKGPDVRLLTVRHVSIYRYASPVSLGEHWMMFRPRESHDLRLTGSTLAITPQPKSLRWMPDVFDTSLAVAT